MQLETKDLILRKGRDDDWEDLYQNLWNQESVFRCMFSRPSPSPEAARKRTAAYVEMHQLTETEFFVIEKASAQAIGIAGIKKMGSGSYTVTDIAIGPQFSGHGYGKQILSALAELAFSELHAEKLLYNCFAQNEISKRLAVSCGFVYSHSGIAELQKNGKNVLLAYYRRENHNVYD